MSQPFLSVKLKRRLAALNPNLVCHLKNIRINGRATGCSGFVVNPDSGRIVYINTEKPAYGPISNQNLVRYAENLKDYSGGLNHFASDDQLAEYVVDMLKTGRFDKTVNQIH